MEYVVFKNESGFPVYTRSCNYNVKRGKALYEAPTYREASKFCYWWSCEDARKMLDVTDREFSSYPLIPDNKVIEWWANLPDEGKAEFPETKSYMDICEYHHDPAAYSMNPDY